MYCKICGNLLDDIDQSCKICGTEVERKEKPVEPIEEIIYNPPFEGEASEIAAADETEAAVVAEPVAVVPEVPVSEPEPAAKPAGRPLEFTWNIHEFPKAKKTEDIIFNWNSDGNHVPDQDEKKNEMSPQELEQLLFNEIREESIKNQDSNIEKFFTFSKKNEEFQQLLDKEYERLRKRSETEFEPEPEFEAMVAEPDLELERELKTKLELEPELKPQSQPEPQPELQIQPEPQLTPEVFVAEPTVTEAAAAVDEVPAKPDPIVHSTHKASHIEEMSDARAAYFAGDIVQDNETIKKKLEPEESETEAVIVDETAEELAADQEIENKNADEELAPVPAPIALACETESMERQKKGRLGKGILIVIAIILVAEITILGIRYFAPGSEAAERIGIVQSQVIDSMKGWFSGGDAKDSEEKTDKEPAKDPEKATEVIKQEDENTQIPDATPAADKNKLVASQLEQNKNIEEVRANTTLSFHEDIDYGITDLNQSKPITNNIWMTPKDGAVVYYDQSVVGTVIAFDSQWIDYVNGGSNSVMDLLKKDSKAYRNAATFSKVGKVKESFKLLEIGEIRQGADGFYVWVHEEIQMTEKGKTSDISYNYIYYLEPIDGKMKIVNYYKF